MGNGSPKFMIGGSPHTHISVQEVGELAISNDHAISQNLRRPPHARTSAEAAEEPLHFSSAQVSVLSASRVHQRFPAVASADYFFCFSAFGASAAAFGWRARPLGPGDFDCVCFFGVASAGKQAQRNHPRNATLPRGDFIRAVAFTFSVAFSFSAFSLSLCCRALATAAEAAK